MSPLVFPYAVNIAVLTPVCWALLAGPEPRATGSEVAGLTAPVLGFLVASLWTGILVCSVIGLMLPREMMAVLILQVIYKAVFLAREALPSLVAGIQDGPPLLLTIIFLAIVLTYPIVIWHALRP